MRADLRNEGSARNTKREIGGTGASGALQMRPPSNEAAKPAGERTIRSASPFNLGREDLRGPKNQEEIGQAPPTTPASSGPRLYEERVRRSAYQPGTAAPLLMHPKGWCN